MSTRTTPRLALASLAGCAASLLIGAPHPSRAQPADNALYRTCKSSASRSGQGDTNVNAAPRVTESRKPDLADRSGATGHAESPDVPDSLPSEQFYRRRAFSGRSPSYAYPGHAVGVSGLSDSFLLGTAEVSRRIGCRTRDLLAVMMRESSLNAGAWNRSSRAVGLIQFLPSTLARLGWSGSPEQFRMLSAEEQLPWVEAFLRPYSRYSLSTAGRVYQAIFMPASLRAGAGEETTLIDIRGINADRYDRNRGLDENGDGRITVGELTQAVDRCRRTAPWRAVEARLRNIEGHGGSSQINDGWVSRPSHGRNAAYTGSPSGTNPGSYRNPDPWVDEPRRAPGRDREYRIEPSDRSGLDLRSADGLTDALSAIGYNIQSASFMAAVRDFQRHAGLIVDGIPGPKTRAALAAELDYAGIAYTL